MDAFRISLIVVGVTVLLGIYLFDSNKKIRLFIKNIRLRDYFRSTDNTTEQYAQEPEINDNSEILEQIEKLDDVVTNPDKSISQSNEQPHVKEQDIIELTEEITVLPGEEMVIVFFIISRGEQYFSGVDIHNICVANGFEYSDKMIYEKFSDTNLKDKRAVASIVNSFEPGTFDSDFENFDTKAITVLLYLPGPDPEMKSFDDIVVRAKDIAQTLNGELCDETRSVLTQQTISHIEEKIEAFQFKNKMLKTSSRN